MKRILSILLIFIACPSLFAYDFQVNGIYYYIISGKKEVSVTYDYNNKYSGHVEIPSSVNYNGISYSVTSIGYSAFYGCSGLTSVTIPNSVTTIINCAFEGCVNLREVTIGNYVTSIGFSAFEDCSRLTSVTIPTSVTSIGHRAFLNTGIYNNYANWTESVLYIDNCLIEAKSTINGNYSIKNNARLIASSAFSECTGLTSVTIPISVTTINNEAFSGCSGLTCVTIPNSVITIGDNAFSECSSLTEVTIGNSVTSIGNGAFSGCTGLTSVIVPNSVTSIGEYAFKGCKGLTSLTIGNTVTSIGREAFSYCSGLAEVNIPNSVTSIGTRAFNLCGSLKKVTFGNSVTTIVDRAFEDCYNLSEIYSKIKNPEDVVMGLGVFYRVPTNNCTLYIPIGCQSKYESTFQWKDFKNIVEMDFDAVLSGDCNGDGIIDAADIAHIVDYLLGIGHGGFDSNAADLNGDGKVDATDISRIIRLILSE